MGSAATSRRPTSCCGSDAMVHLFGPDYAAVGGRERCAGNLEDGREILVLFLRGGAIESGLSRLPIQLGEGLRQVVE